MGPAPIRHGFALVNPTRDDGHRLAWQLASAAGREAMALEAGGAPATCCLGADGGLTRLRAGHPDGQLTWQPGEGWTSLLSPDHPGHALLDLYLPISSATTARPMTIGHLGQSLDGFIATHEGESQWVTGPENLVHMHRLRALCDAVVVGAGTVAADDPQLTNRLVEGASPLRVVIDPTRRLGPHYRVFADAAIATICVTARSRLAPGEQRIGSAEIVAVDEGPDGLRLCQVVEALRARGCPRVFIEGGGRTVSSFVEAGLLDRLHITIAPILIGDGRPGIRLPRPSTLGHCQRPAYRVFRMGADVLFDCDLSSRDDTPAGTETVPPIVRVI